MDRQEHRFIDLEGDTRTRYQALGEAFRPHLAHTVDAFLGLELIPDWLPAAAQLATVRSAIGLSGRFYLDRQRPALARIQGGTPLARVEGLAAGLGISPAFLYGLNTYEIESCTVGFALGCTSLGLSGDQTRDGAPRLAYNHDFPPSFSPYLRLRRHLPRGGDGSSLRNLSLGYGVMAGAIAGVNEAGLAVSIDQAFCTDIRRWRPAIPPSLLVQDILDHCRDVHAAVARLTETPVTNGSMFTLVDAAGHRVVVERSPTRAAIRRPDADDVLATFNKYLAPGMEAVEIPVGARTTGLVPGVDLHECNFTRQRRLDTLVHGHAGAFDDDDLRRLLGDHDGGEGDTNTICRHDDPLAETICSTVIDPRRRAMEVVFGKPCQGEARRFELDRGEVSEPVEAVA